MDRRRAPAGPTAGNAGFTLIEVMVALAVFSIAALALLRLEGATIRSTDTLGRTLEANLVARNVAIEAMTDARPPTLGSGGGIAAEGGRNWTWTRLVSPTGDPRVLRIDVTVVDPRGQQLGRITMIRPPAVATT
ncbi:type II secretion system minor pseudopilin GspI [Sphingomonas bacterium]|uniref:type II secretion system minor pseudopilin GspI n=1 Tax=Sphingomonas bacterium TaxID=1895847 RepID=UPI00157552D6|nr:type II secretion system minor pseudopilin GspI [Sphingomonas bacterium]